MNHLINQILKGDCIEKLKEIPDESIDLIFADPPYFMQTEGELLRSDGSKFSGVEDHWDKFNNYEHYDNFCCQWLSECKRVLKKNGTIWVIGAFQNIYRLGYIMQNLGFWILNDVIWSKPNAVPNFGGTRFQNSHETLLWCSKDKNAKFTFNYKTMKALNGDKQDKSVWDIGICIGSERIKGKDGKKAHSTQKPERLLSKVILSSSRPNDIVLDPFFGSGTTGVVAKRYGREFIGIEREQKYIDVALKRLNNTKLELDSYALRELEVKPPKVSLEELIKNGYLSYEEKFYNKNGEYICKLQKDNKVSDDEETLSIHKMSAKYLKKANHNGWDYFYIKSQNSELISIDDLRYKHNEEQK